MLEARIPHFQSRVAMQRQHIKDVPHTKMNRIGLYWVIGTILGFRTDYRIGRNRVLLDLIV